MNTNEYDFCKKIVNLDEKVSKTLYYIKENYGINAEFDDENNKFILEVNNINEGNQLLSAKEYIYSIFDNEYISTNID